MTDEWRKASGGTWLPLRAVVPGWYGMDSVKWLHAIELLPSLSPHAIFSAGRSRNSAFATRDRSPPYDAAPALVAILPPGPGLLEQADEAFRAEEWGKAAALARRAVAQDPGVVHGLLILGLLAARENHLLYASRSNADIPTASRLSVELAMAQDESGLPARALQTLAAIDAPAARAQTAQYFGVTSFAEGKLNRLADAALHVRRALEIDKTDQAPRALSPSAFSTKPNTASRAADSWCSIAAVYTPDVPTVHYQLGLLYRRLGQPQKAGEHFRKSKQP